MLHRCTVLELHKPRISYSVSQKLLKCPSITCCGQSSFCEQTWLKYEAHDSCMFRLWTSLSLSLPKLRATNESSYCVQYILEVHSRTSLPDSLILARNSSVGIRAGWSDDRGSIPGEGWEVPSSTPCPDRLRGPPSLLSNRYQGLFRWGKATGVLNKPTTHIQLVPGSKNVWSYTYTLPMSSWRGA
jgi:hypothetical protein